MLERLKGQKSMTITYTVFPSGIGGRDDADADCFFRRCSFAGAAQVQRI